MAFNRENLTSIAILLEYFTIETRDHTYLSTQDSLKTIDDVSFRFEIARMHHLYKKFKVDSVLLVLRIESELQSLRLYDKIQKMLRSLDRVSIVKSTQFHYIVMLFPLHDNAAALGFLNRLNNNISERDAEFEYMTFSIDRLDLMQEYLLEYK
jgi:hypothetical protein